MNKFVNAGAAALSTAVIASSLPVPAPAFAGAGEIIEAPVKARQADGAMQPVKNAVAKLLRTESGIFASLDTAELKPGHAYTLWIAAIHAPENCEQFPCKSAEVLGKTDLVMADMGHGDGAIAGPNGRARFAAFQPKGELPNAWFGSGLADVGAEIHLVVRDHGPIVVGLEAEMLGTYRAGCRDDTIPEIVPATARGDGEAGPNDCSNAQVAVFPPAN